MDHNVYFTSQLESSMGIIIESRLIKVADVEGPRDQRSTKHQGLGYIPNFANGFLFDEKVPFDLISIKNEGFGFLLDDDYLK